MDPILIGTGFFILAAVVWVQTQRPDLAAESVSGGGTSLREAAPQPLVGGERRV